MLTIQAGKTRYITPEVVNMKVIMNDDFDSIEAIYISDEEDNEVLLDKILDMTALQYNNSDLFEKILKASGVDPEDVMEKLNPNGKCTCKKCGRNK